jgi:hypothetical protein
MDSPVLQFFKPSLAGRVSRGGSLSLVLTLALFAVLPAARALLPPPPPDGGYPGANTAEGHNALFNLTSGSNNTAMGASALFSNTDGLANTAVGESALYNNTSGDNNTATGAEALAFNTNGEQNTANGRYALHFNTTGDNNTASGYGALFDNKSGGSNTATGMFALSNNSGGSLNTANGAQALSRNTTAFFNTAMGSQAMFNNRTGLSNTANGYQALFTNETGGSNTANGVQALYRTTGGGNIALGFQAGVNLTTGSNNIDIGNAGVAGESNTIRIGKSGTQTKTFVAGVNEAAVTGSAVKISAAGQLGTAPSSARFKDAIKPMEKASEAIEALRPVTFRYKPEIDSEGVPQFGLVAEEVEKVNPDLVVRGEDGKPYTVRYEAVNAMLLNEFLKEHRKVQEQEQKLQKQEVTILRQEKDFESKFAQQQKQIEALTATVRKVSEQVELSARAPRMAANED